MQRNFKKYGLLQYYQKQIALCYENFRREFKEVGCLIDDLNIRIVDEVFSVLSNEKFDVHEWRLNIEFIQEQIKLLEIDLRRYAVSIIQPFVKALTLIQIKAKTRLKQLKSEIALSVNEPFKIVDVAIINC